MWISGCFCAPQLCNSPHSQFSIHQQGPALWMQHPLGKGLRQQGQTQYKISPGEISQTHMQNTVKRIQMCVNKCSSTTDTAVNTAGYMKIITHIYYEWSVIFSHYQPFVYLMHMVNSLQTSVKHMTHSKYREYVH